MNWTSVKLIVGREVLDQLRDRRTLFVIAVLPVLLYPLIGMSFFQVAQFVRKHPTRIWVVGDEHLPATPQLLVEGGFAEGLYPGQETQLFELTLADGPVQGNFNAVADRAVKSDLYDAVVRFRPGFSERLAQLAEAGDSAGHASLGTSAGPEIYFDRSRDKSRIAYQRVVAILNQWRSRIVEQTLTEKALPPAAAEPFQIVDQDVSEGRGRRTAVWSKVLPFVVIIWALTGAFYPAVDLCAGEKERGTLETLLSSPAERHEIVWGKLITVMLFSMGTSLLNLLSMGLTGSFVIQRMQVLGMSGMQIDPPPFLTMGWLVLSLVPISALFSALSLALAAMARSTKEGQYYLMPLLLGTMPLMMMSMLPAFELDLGTSLIPITGVILLLRNLMEGQYAVALRFALPVVGMTALCCWMAIRWAVSQFDEESVLFRESERFDLRCWLVHLVRDRSETPSVAQAFLCASLLMLIRFFAGFLLPAPDSWNGFAVSTLTVQIALIAAPALLLTLLLTRRPMHALMLRWPRSAAMPAAMLLAVALHPAATAVAHAVHTLYPLSEQTLQQLDSLEQVFVQSPSMLHVILLLALTPAICEELAFRGFILSGLRRLGPGMAILISSLFFGIAHMVLQQSLTAFALGLVIGYLAVKTRSLLPCMLFHLVHNALQLVTGMLLAKYGDQGFYGLVRIADRGQLVYHWAAILVSGLAGAAILYWFHTRSHAESEKEHVPSKHLSYVPNVSRIEG